MAAPCKLALLLTLASSPLLAQSTWQFGHTTEELTIATDGTLQIDGESIPLVLAGNGIVSLQGEGVDLTVAAGKDVLVERSTDPSELLFTVVTKRPASLTPAEMAGSWTYHEFVIEESADGPVLHGFSTTTLGVTVNATGGVSIAGLISGTATIDARNHILLTLPDETIDFAINASKDLMVSTTSEEGSHFFRLILRRESGGSTSQLAGPWTLSALGVNSDPASAQFGLDVADFEVSPTGTFTFPGETQAISLTADGSGGVTANDDGDLIDLTWSQSHDLLAFAASNGSEHELAFLTRRPTTLALADLAGTWDLHDLAIENPNLSETTAEAFHPDGSLAERYEFVETDDEELLRDGLATTYYEGSEIRESETNWLADVMAGTSVKNGLARTFGFDGTTVIRSENYVDDVLAGSPALQVWNMDGQLILTEDWSGGQVTRRIERQFNGPGDPSPAMVTTTSFSGGTATSRLEQSYHPGTTSLSFLANTIFTGGVATRQETTSFQTDGTTKIQESLTVSTPAGVVTEQRNTNYRPDGVGLTSTSTCLFQADGTPISCVVTNYYPDGTTVQSRETTTYPAGTTRIFREYFRETSTRSRETLTIRTGGVVTEESTTDFLEDGVGINQTTAATFELDGSPIDSISTTYHPDGTTVASRETTTFPAGGTHVLTENFYPTGVKSYELLVIDDLLISQRSFYANGNTREHNGYSYLEGVQVIGTERFYDNGTKEYDALTIGGKLDGTVTFWHPNGKLQRRTVYSLGTLDGLDETFDTEERPTSVAVYDAGILQSRTETSYYPSGQKQSETLATYADGKTTVAITEWNADGTLRSQTRTVDGEQDGLQRYYDTQGRPTESASYKAGVLHGAITSWYPNSTQIQETGSYRDGERDGLWTSYYNDGQVQSRDTYARGERHGEASSYSYDENGRQLTQQQWVRGALRHDESWLYDETDETDTLRRHLVRTTRIGDLSRFGFPAEAGLEETWDEQGRMVRYSESAYDQQEGETRIYREGVLTRRSQYLGGRLDGLDEQFFFDPSNPDNPTNGNLQSAREHVAGRLDGLTLIYNPENGWLLERAHYSQGQLHGFRERFFDQGSSPTPESPSETGSFIHGLRNGLHTSWVEPNGARTEATYLADQLHGPWRRYYKFGGLYEAGHHDDNEKSGQWTTYDAQSRPIDRRNYLDGLLHGLWERFTEGKPISRHRYSYGVPDGLWEEFSFIGQSYLASTTVHDQGVEAGPRRTYFPNGKLSSFTPLSNGLFHGTALTYHDNGQLGSSTGYAQGRPHGAFGAWKRNGGPAATGSYTNGAPSGIWTEWWPFEDRTLIWKQGPRGGSGQCGEWKIWGYDEDFQSVFVGTIDYGPCEPINPPPGPVSRILEGTVSVSEGSPLGASVSLHPQEGVWSASTTAGPDGSFRIRIEGSSTEFLLSVSHPGHRTVGLSLQIPYQSGTTTQDVTLVTPDKPGVTLGFPSVTGTNFLQGVPLRVQFPDLMVDWGDARSGNLRWRQGSYGGSFSRTGIEPGIDLNPSPNARIAEVIAKNGFGRESAPAELPEFIIYPQPEWAQGLGTWTAKQNESGTPATYQLSSAWPANDPSGAERSLDFGISEDSLGPLWVVWETLPVLGKGDLGAFDIRFFIDANASTAGPGKLNFGGQGELRGAGKTGRLEAAGKGDLVWGESLDVTNASVTIDALIKLEEEVGPVSIFPALKQYENSKSVGWLISKINVAKIEFALLGGLGAELPIDDDTGKLTFRPSNLRLTARSTATATIPLMRFAKLEGKLTGNLLGVWKVENSSSSLESVTYTTSGEAKINYLDRVYDATYSHSLTYPDDFKSQRSKATTPKVTGNQLVQPDFLEHGDYAQFLPSEAPRKNAPGETLDSPLPPTQTLLGNSYRYANPVVAEHNGTRVLVYVHYDPARPDGQSTRLFFTIDDGTGFSVPAPVHNEARADFNPQLAFLPDGRLIAVFETSKLNQIALTAEERVSGLETAWSIYDPNAGTWSAPALLSDNNYVDHSPRLAASPQGPMVVWQSNAGDEIVGTDLFPTQIHYATWSGSAFSAPALLPAAIQPEGDTDLAFDGTEAVFTWINDEDRDPVTVNDTELYWSKFDGTTWSAPVRANNDSLPDARPRVFCLENGSFELLWTKGIDLVRMADFTTHTHEVIRSSSSETTPPIYDVTCDAQGRIALLWSVFEEGQVDLRYAVLDPSTGGWSNELPLTNDDGIEKSPSFALSGNGNLIATFLREEAETTQHDLLWLERGLAQDLTIGPITIEPSGEPDHFTIGAEFRNLGDLAAKNVTVDFHLGDPEAGGTLLGSAVIDIAGGYVCPQSITTSGLAPGADGTLFVRIDPANAIAESNETNNSATTALNPVDLVAENLLWERSADGDLLTLTGTVHNKGRTTQTDIPVKITGEQGDLLIATIPSLPPGTRVEVPGVLATATAFPTDDNRFTLKVDPEDTLKDVDREDNDYTLPLTLREPGDADSDGDKIADYWELANFGNLDRDGTGDFDGDGNPDLFEQLHSTDPKDGNSLFEFSVDPDPVRPGDVLLTFPTVSGVNYRIQRSTDLHTWLDYTLHAGTGAELIVPVAGIPNPGDGRSHLNSFRIQAEKD